MLDLPEDDILLSGMLSPYQHLEDTTFLQNVCSFLQLSTMLHQRSLESSTAML
jgi:hypothetical protein